MSFDKMVKSQKRYITIKGKSTTVE